MQIGELARLTRISVRMLRHYDEIDLFKPNLVRENTYREYSVSQLPLLNKILALKDLGFSLEQVRGLVKENFAADHLRALLEQRRDELETHIVQEQGRLGRVEGRLSQIEKENHVPEFSIKVKSIPAQLVASVRDSSLDEFQQLEDGETNRLMRNYFSTLFTHLERHGEAVGVPFTIIGHSPMDEGSILMDIEVTKTIAKRVPESDLVRVYELSATPIMACLEYSGPSDWHVIELQALPALHTWIEQHGFKSVGLVRQTYLELNQEINDAPCVLEWQIPVAPA
jgi:DNA-binding transcriptional MerR regulator